MPSISGSSPLPSPSPREDFVVQISENGPSIKLSVNRDAAALHSLLIRNDTCTFDQPQDLTCGAVIMDTISGRRSHYRPILKADLLAASLGEDAYQDFARGVLLTSSMTYRVPQGFLEQCDYREVEFYSRLAIQVASLLALRQEAEERASHSTEDSQARTLSLVESALQNTVSRLLAAPARGEVNDNDPKPLLEEILFRGEGESRMKAQIARYFGDWERYRTAEISNAHSIDLGISEATEVPYRPQLELNEASLSIPGYSTQAAMTAKFASILTPETPDEVAAWQTPLLTFQRTLREQRPDITSLNFAPPAPDPKQDELDSHSTKLQKSILSEIAHHGDHSSVWVITDISGLLKNTQTLVCSEQKLLSDHNFRGIVIDYLNARNPRTTEQLLIDMNIAASIQIPDKVQTELNYLCYLREASSHNGIPLKVLDFREGQPQIQLVQPGQQLVLIGFQDPKLDLITSIAGSLLGHGSEERMLRVIHEELRRHASFVEQLAEQSGFISGSRCFNQAIVALTEDYPEALGWGEGMSIGLRGADLHARFQNSRIPSDQFPSCVTSLYQPSGHPSTRFERRLERAASLIFVSATSKDDDSDGMMGVASDPQLSLTR